ncbi:MAG: hypothetical protein K0S20_186 [Patescibacteria group bacterium]|jgi:hypothetical protein|nr:hypothetical protein [Patescibacteria group bacterium]
MTQVINSGESVAPATAEAKTKDAYNFYPGDERTDDGSPQVDPGTINIRHHTYVPPECIHPNASDD